MRRKIFIIVIMLFMNIISGYCRDTVDLKLIKKTPLPNFKKAHSFLRGGEKYFPNLYFILREDKMYFITTEVYPKDFKTAIVLNIIDIKKGVVEDKITLEEMVCSEEDRNTIEKNDFLRNRIESILHGKVYLEGFNINSQSSKACILYRQCSGAKLIKREKPKYSLFYKTEEERWFTCTYEKDDFKVLLFDLGKKTILINQILPDFEEKYKSLEYVCITDKSIVLVDDDFRKGEFKISCLNIEDGFLFWQIKELTDYVFFTPPLIQDNKIFLVTKQHERDENGQSTMVYHSHVWCLSLEDGSVVWKREGIGGDFLNIYQDTLFMYFPNHCLYGLNINTGKVVYLFDHEDRLGKTGFIIKELRRLEKAAPIIDPEEGVIYTCYYGRGVVLSLDKPKVVRTYPYRERNSVNESKEYKESHKEVNVLFFPLRHPRPSINAPEEEIMEYFRKIELHEYYNIDWEGNNLVVRDKYLILRGGIYNKKTGQRIREALIYGDIIFYDDKRIYSLSTLGKEPAIYCYEFIEGKETPEIQGNVTLSTNPHCGRVLL